VPATIYSRKVIFNAKIARVKRSRKRRRFCESGTRENPGKLRTDARALVRCEEVF